MRPTTGDELRDEREAADELGISVDELRARRAASLTADLDTATHRRAPVLPLDPATVELGRRKLAELRPLLRTRHERPAPVRHLCPHCLSTIGLDAVAAHYRDTGDAPTPPAGACPVLFTLRNGGAS